MDNDASHKWRRHTDVRVHTRLKNGSCEIAQLFETFGRDKFYVIEQAVFCQCTTTRTRGFVAATLWIRPVSQVSHTLEI